LSNLPTRVTVLNLTLDQRNWTGTNTFSTAGLVEREGLLWVEDLPLSNVVNTVTLTMTDAASNSASTTITVNQSSVTLTVNDVTDDQLWQPTVTVTGTISPATGYAVWVNGVQATVNSDGTWNAANVPITPGGTAVPRRHGGIPGQGDSN
jgi:hypothetical protein